MMFCSISSWNNGGGGKSRTNTINGDTTFVISLFNTIKEKYDNKYNKIFYVINNNFFYHYN